MDSEEAESTEQSVNLYVLYKHLLWQIQIIQKWALKQKTRSLQSDSIQTGTKVMFQSSSETSHSAHHFFGMF